MPAGWAIVLVLNRLGPGARPARGVRHHRRAGAVRSGRGRRTPPDFSPSISPGSIVGNRPTRAHNTVIVFLDAATWLAQIVMFVLLGLLAWPERLPQRALPALVVAAGADADRAAGRRFPVPRRRSAFRAARSCSSRGSACAARSAFSSRRSRCWSACRTRSSISTSASWWCWCRCWCRAGPSGRRRTAAHRAAAQRSGAAPRRARPAGPIGAGARRLHGRRQQSLSAPRASHPVVGEADAGGARASACSAGGSRRRARGRLPLSAGAAGKARRRSTASSSTCRRRSRPTRGFSAISSCPATRRSARWPRFTGSRDRAGAEADQSLADYFASGSATVRRARATCCRSAPSHWWPMRLPTAA